MRCHEIVVLLHLLGDRRVQRFFVRQFGQEHRGHGKQQERADQERDLRWGGTGFGVHGGILAGLLGIFAGNRQAVRGILRDKKMHLTYRRAVGISTIALGFVVARWGFPAMFRRRCSPPLSRLNGQGAWFFKGQSSEVRIHPLRFIRLLPGFLLKRTAICRGLFSGLSW